MRTAIVVPIIESVNGSLARDPVADRIASDTVLKAMIATSTPRVRTRALAFPIKSK